VVRSNECFDHLFLQVQAGAGVKGIKAEHGVNQVLFKGHAYQSSAVATLPTRRGNGCVSESLLCETKPPQSHSPTATNRRRARGIRRRNCRPNQGRQLVENGATYPYAAQERVALGQPNSPKLQRVSRKKFPKGSAKGATLKLTRQRPGNALGIRETSFESLFSAEETVLESRKSWYYH
jgi:hypothetical protein